MKKYSISENQRLILLLLSVILPPLINWFANAMPTDRVAIGSLIAAVLSAILVLILKILTETSSDCPDDAKKNPSLIERVAVLENDIGWIKKKLDSIDNRIWWILGSVVIFGIITIAVALYH